MAVQDGAGDPLALGRVTLVGEVAELRGAERCSRACSAAGRGPSRRG
jgi:hypothetical protein